MQQCKYSSRELEVAMRRYAAVLFLVLIALSGCSLFLQDTYYFYSMFDKAEGEPYEFHLKPSSRGYTISMSKGNHEDSGFTQEQAEAQRDTTNFTLQLDGVDLVTDGVKYVAELDVGWHVVQDFSTGSLARGTYSLVGTTVGLRTDTITLQVR